MRIFDLPKNVDDKCSQLVDNLFFCCCVVTFNINNKIENHVLSKEKWVM